MKSLPRFDKRAAETEAAEAKTWWCSDCGLPNEEGQSLCESCRQYWDDVDNGLFEFDQPAYHEDDHYGYLDDVDKLELELELERAYDEMNQYEHFYDFE